MGRAMEDLALQSIEMVVKDNGGNPASALAMAS